MICIQVPGSTSNLGSGFDSIGLAVDRYLRLEATEDEKWFFEQKSENLGGIPKGEDNLIYRIAASVAQGAGRRLPRCRVSVDSELPLARGLGSSAAAIVAGIELADQLLNLNFNKEDKFAWACRFEGHYDNVGASIYGGLVVSGEIKGKPRVLKAIVPEVDLVIAVPNYELKTEDARNVLPDTLPFKKAVTGSGVANLMITAILQNNWPLAGELMSEDVFHQPYRAPLVPDLRLAQETAKEAGAYGLALSGAGPALIAFVPKGKGGRISKKLQERFPKEDIIVTRPAEAGVCSKKKIPFTKQAL